MKKNKQIRLSFHRRSMNEDQPVVFPANTTILKAEWVDNWDAFLVEWMEEEEV